MVRRIPKKRKVSKKKVSVFSAILTKSLVAKTLSLFLVFSLSFFSLAPTTNAHYNDIEKSIGNIWTAGILDFLIKKKSFEASIGPEVFDEKTHVSILVPSNGSLPMKYTLNNLVKYEDGGLCGKLFVEAKLDGLTKYSGPFSSLVNSTTTEFGTWEFRFDMPPETIASHGDKCNAETILNAWREDVETPEESVFTDTERISFSFKAKMIVLNEIYPRPTGDTPPFNKEYIEIYNNGSTPIDLAGWKVSDMASTTEKFYTITSTPGSNTAVPVGGSTVLPSLGYLVLNMSDGSTLNNSGDTVRLYDDKSVLQDEYIYSAVSEGKSIVRFPDGIGFWIDPEPTPGNSNTISLKDLEESGFDEETIKQILALAEMKNINLAPEIEELSLQETVDEAEIVENFENIELFNTTEENGTTTESLVEQDNEENSATTEEVILSEEVNEDLEKEENESTNLVLDENEIDTEVSEELNDEELNDEEIIEEEIVLLEDETTIPEEKVVEGVTNISTEEEVLEFPPYKEEEIVEIENENSLEGEKENSGIVTEEIIIKEEVVSVSEVVETPVVEAPKTETNPESTENNVVNETE